MTTKRTLALVTAHKALVACGLKVTRLEAKTDHIHLCTRRPSVIAEFDGSAGADLGAIGEGCTPNGYCLDCVAYGSACSWVWFSYREAPFDAKVAQP